MKRKNICTRVLACILFGTLPVVLCVSLLALAAQARVEGCTPYLQTTVRQSESENGEAELCYTLEIGNEGTSPLTDGELTHENLEGRHPEGIRIVGDGYESCSTSKRGLVLRGINLQPGEVLRIQYSIRALLPLPGERISILFATQDSNSGTFGVGGGLETAITLQIPVSRVC